MNNHHQWAPYRSDLNSTFIFGKISTTTKICVTPDTADKAGTADLGVFRGTPDWKHLQEESPEWWKVWEIHLWWTPLRTQSNRCGLVTVQKQLCHISHKNKEKTCGSHYSEGLCDLNAWKCSTRKCFPMFCTPSYGQPVPFPSVYFFILLDMGILEEKLHVLRSNPSWSTTFLYSQ